MEEANTKTKEQSGSPRRSPAVQRQAKDACYHKVKSRYEVWPSAYASGALVKCRKVGAANWGNSKKENINRDRIRELVEAELSKINEGDSEGPVTQVVRSQR